MTEPSRRAEARPDRRPPGRRPRRRPAAHDEARYQHALKVFQQFVRECQACQAEVPQDWQYCAHCGQRLATSCPRCGNPLPPSGGRFCPHCGLEIPQETP
jgi:predicted amidophosphoribosyltransferase